MIFQFVIDNDVIETHKGYKQSDAIDLAYKARMFEIKTKTKEKGHTRLTENLVLVFFERAT